VVVEEIRSYENQPMTRAFRRLLAAIGGDHPYSLDPLGLQEHLAAVSADDLTVYYRNYYRPDNVFAVVAGDVTVEGVRGLAERHFGAWQAAAEASARREAGRFLVATGRSVQRLSIEVPLTARVHRLPPPGEIDRPALELLTALLGDGESSPLQEELVGRRRLCVHAGAQCFRLLRGGVLVFYGAFLPPGRHAPRREVIRRLCERMAGAGPDPAAFARLLRRARHERAGESYSANGRMLGLGSAQLLEGSYRAYERALQDLAEVTPERVRDLAARLFAPENTLELDVVPERTRWWMPLAGLVMGLWPR
jgi:zinc protease